MNGQLPTEFEAVGSISAMKNLLDYDDWLNDLAATAVLFSLAVGLILAFGTYRGQELMRRWWG